MPKYRKSRVDGAFAEACSEILREIKDPRVSGVMLSVMNADVSADFKFAKVYYSVYGQHDEKELAKGLKSAVPFVRSRIAEMLNLRVNPEITFVRDDGIRRGAEISALLKKIEPELEASAAREAEEARRAAEEARNQEADGDE
ncbi:MAG: 30S ribosome-binding factor RbfA [Clostridia bacterium]|nr:30S ribosome-binding factor RbfA [Clostridia bacterium]MBQ4351655.1 30S ribosome-binding factor RbfA [Clostridia bacterium]